VQFVDPSGRIPFLDVEAETTVWHDRRRQEYRVILTILGPIDRLQIRFQSEPPLDEVEILTLLSFGVLPEELAGEESDAQGTAGRELSTIILSGQISRIEQEIQSIIGFDRLEIEPAFSSPRSSSSMQVTLQKRLTERLRLSLSSGLEVGGEQRVELGYRLLEGLDVSLGWNSRIDDPAGSFFTRPRIVIPLP
jgi:autotransporter translocation and assembly factor TamB